MSDTTSGEPAATAGIGLPLSAGEPRSFSGGRYVVRRRLGAGNFATVYLAHDERLDVLVAVKLLSDRWSWEPEVRGRFVQEARLLRSLNDPLVVQIRDIAETDDGRPYLVMDFATEGTLEQRSLDLVQRGVRPLPADVLAAARSLAAAMAVLHERRIAHRDIKPSNLLITRNVPGASLAGAETAIIRPGERLMLGDLGLAKDLAFDSGITVGVGTAGYMAPEQALPGAKIDTRTDIYAASALLAQLASGEAPDPVRRVSNGQLDAGRPFPSNIPGPLAAALLRGLETEPERRPQTIGEWLAGVERGIQASSMPAPTPRPPVPPPPAPVAAVPSNPPPVHAAAHQGPPTGPVRVGPLPAGNTPPETWQSVNRQGGLAGLLGAGKRRIAILGAAAVLGGGAIGLAATSLGDDTPSTNTTAPGGLTVKLDGLTTIKRFQRAEWTVDAPGAVSGTWSLTGPVQPSPAEWAPGNSMQGTWKVTGQFTLTLTVVDAEGNTATDSLVFEVVE